MGDLEKIPTFLTVGVLVIIFVCLKRQARSARLTLWTVGWTLVFTHFLAQLLEPHNAAPSSVLLAIDLASLQAAAATFLVSTSSVVEDGSKRTVTLLALSLPAIAYSICIACQISAVWPHAFFLLAAFVGAAYCYSGGPRRWSLHSVTAAVLCSIAGLWAFRAALRGSFAEGAVALLGLALGLSGWFIARKKLRSSPAALTMAGGFLFWGGAFPLRLAIDRHVPHLFVPGELWNMPTFFVAFGMILAVVEEKSGSLAGMQRQAQVLNRQLERFSAITSRLLGGARPDTVCPAITSAITEVSNFTVAVIQLEDAERRLQITGSSGLSTHGILRLQEMTRSWTVDHLRDLCGESRLIAKNSYLLPRKEGILFAPRWNPNRHWERGEEILIPLCSAGGAIMGCLRLAAPREPNAIQAVELSHVEMLAADLAVAVELKALHTQLVWSEKLAALGQLLAGVAHELNNPLTVIMGYGELIGDSITAPQPREQMLKLVGEARRMKRIIENLLRFSRQSVRDAQMVQLSPVVQEVLALREYHTRTRNVKIELDIAKDLPFLAVNEDEIKQILLNLFNNSSDALEGIDGPKRICIRAHRNGAKAIIEMEDTGPGFGNLNRALDPFYTTKPVGKGTGLGLSVCYGIVKERGGDLRIENVLPRGARVTLELPLFESASPLLAAVARA